MGARLAGRICAVTGAASGLGRETAQRFASEGATVFAMDTNADLLREIATDSIVPMQMDVASSQSVEKSFAAIRDKHGGLDAIVCAAGIVGSKYGDGPAAECTESGWDMLMSVNLKGVWLSCKYAIPLMLARGGGSIVTISSVTALKPPMEFFRSHAYMTAKGGVVSLTKAIAAYYGRSKIRANVVAPGMIDTPMSKRMQGVSEIMEFLDKVTPLGALGEPSDIANACLFFASDESKFVSGQIMSVDGGWTNHA
ncbi:MAG: short-chain dehydrogenase/reductase [Deltaproteobacteria bacterium]|nr:short-chain dehydrogenase/reductase [Deltaproteobacteria bacterium]